MKTLAALLIILAAAATGFAAQWKVLPEATVRAETITLADLVENAPAGWSKVFLAASPRPGKSTVVESSVIRTRAADLLGTDTLEAPKSVTVTRPGRQVTRDEVEEAITEAVYQRYGGDLSLHFESIGLPPQVADGDMKLEVRLPRGNLPTKTTLWVDLIVDGNQAGRASARVEAKSPETNMAVVLLRGLKKGEVVKAEDVGFSQGRGRPGALTNVDDAIGKVVTRTLTSGSVLSSDQLASRTLVRKGSLVRLVAHIGGVTASTSGRALADGAANELIGVENTTSNQVVQGIVREAGLVETVSQSREVN